MGEFNVIGDRQFTASIRTVLVQLQR